MAARFGSATITITSTARALRTIIRYGNSTLTITSAGDGAIVSPAPDTPTTDCVDAETSTHSHTASGSNTLLVVTVHTANGLSATNVNFGGATLTEVLSITHASGKPYVSVWRLINANGTNNVVVTLSSTDKMCVGAIVYAGVDQTTPIDGATSAEGTSNTISVMVTSEVDDLVQDAAASLAIEDHSPGAGQTEEWELEIGGPGISGNKAMVSLEAGSSLKRTRLPMICSSVGQA